MLHWFISLRFAARALCEAQRLAALLKDINLQIFKVSYAHLKELKN